MTTSQARPGINQLTGSMSEIEFNPEREDKLVTSRHDKMVKQNIFLSVSAALRILHAEIGYRRELDQLKEIVAKIKSSFPNHREGLPDTFEDRKHRFAHIFLFCKTHVTLVASALKLVPAPHCELLSNCTQVACLGGGSGDWASVSNKFC